MEITKRLTLEAAKSPRTKAGQLMLEAVSHIESLRREIRTQRAEIGQLINERNVLLDWDKPPMQQYDKEKIDSDE